MTALLPPSTRKKRSVKAPLSAGEKLFSARKKLKLDLVEIEKKTLIRAKYLEALEQSKFYVLPLAVYTYGFVQTYASFLGLNPKRLLQQFQEEYGTAQGSSVNHLVLDSSLQPARVIVTPKILWRGFALTVLVALIAYFGSQVANFAGVPTLTLDSPSQQAEITGDTVTVSGATDPGTAIHIGQQNIPVSEDGRFVQDMRVSQGVNNIVVKAENRLGKTRVQTRVIKANAPATALLLSGERSNGQN